jgi:hypothetical protein
MILDSKSEKVMLKVFLNMFFYMTFQHEDSSANNPCDTKLS